MNPLPPDITQLEPHEEFTLNSIKNVDLTKMSKQQLLDIIASNYVLLCVKDKLIKYLTKRENQT